MQYLQNKINKYFLIDIIFLIFLSLLYLLGDINSIIFGKIVIILAIASHIQLLLRYKNTDYLFIFFIFGLLYWLYLLAYYFLGIPYHYLLEYQKVNYTNTIVLLQILLLRVMFIGISPSKVKIFRNSFVYRDNDIVFVLFSTILLCMVPIILVTTPLLISGNYSIETKSSSLLEYAIIFILIATIYANSKTKQMIIVSISSIYLFLPLMYGKRLAFLMIGLLSFILFFSGKFKMRYILFSTVIGFIFLRVFAAVRVGFENLNIVTFLLGVNEDGIMSNNQGGVVVCSVTYFGLIQEGLFDIYFRFKSLLGTLVGIFLPSSLNFKEAYVNLYAMNFASIPGNGGFTSIYLYIWGGLLGVIIGGIIFNYLLRNPHNSRLIFIYMIFVFATFPRWYSYNMFILLKMGFWLMFFLAIADTINKYTKRRYTIK